MEEQGTQTLVELRTEPAGQAQAELRQAQVLRLAFQLHPPLHPQAVTLVLVPVLPATSLQLMQLSLLDPGIETASQMQEGTLGSQIMLSLQLQAFPEGVTVPAE
jgi:hypothetical protein